MPYNIQIAIQVGMDLQQAGNAIPCLASDGPRIEETEENTDKNNLPYIHWHKTGEEETT